MALSDVALCARALMRIGASPISSFDDGTVEAQVSRALFGSVSDALLSAYGWSFAMTEQVLNLVDEPSLANYRYAYELPFGFLRALSVGTLSGGRVEEYRLARGRIYTRCGDAVLTYIFRPDEVVFPAYFDQALIARLAAEFTIPITESTSRAEVMFGLSEREFERARQVDAQQDTPMAFERFPLVDVRGV